MSQSQIQTLQQGRSRRRVLVCQHGTAVVTCYDVYYPTQIHQLNQQLYHVLM
jgi:hypothetical protein